MVSTTRFVAIGLAAMLLVSLLAGPVAGSSADRYEIHLAAAPTPEQMQALKNLCSATHFVFDELNVIVASIPGHKLAEVEGLDFVTFVSPDGAAYADHAGYLSWDVDMIDADLMHLSPAAPTFVDGSGVYAAVLDTGLVPNWQDYFPADRVATEYAMSFHNPQYNENPGGWLDTEGHGTHVTSTILGFSVYGLYNVEGVAPGVKVIPVKVLNNQGWGWNSSVTAGILYIANLKASGEITAPVVINMSLGSSVPSPAEEAAIDYAIANGVVVVASAGNRGDAGMGYPGAYAQVISAGASGWTGEWTPGVASWWRMRSGWSVPEGDVSPYTYVCGFSSREKGGQDLDVLAPGSWVVGPYLNQGAARPPYWAQGVPGQYYYLGGTSMAAPHVTGTVALMLQADPGLTASQVETILESTAIPIAAGAATVYRPGGVTATFTWGLDATGSGLLQTDAAVAAAAGP